MKQFCPQNHDTFVVGRVARGTCKECASECNKKWQKEKCRQSYKL